LRPSAGPDPWPRPRLRIAADGPAMGAGRGPNGPPSGAPARPRGCGKMARICAFHGPG
jgi:hypothetical protein